MKETKHSLGSSSFKETFCIYSGNFIQENNADSVLYDNIYSLSKISKYNNVDVFFSGVIYNIEEIKNKLQTSSSDLKEIIVELYLKTGLNFTDQIEGHFSICLIDHNLNKLILLRDLHLMEKIYYYIGSNDEFIISNSIFCFKKYIKLELNKKILPEFFMRSHIRSGISTFYKDIYTLSEFETIEYDLINKKWEHQINNAYTKYEPNKLSDKQIIDDIENIMHKNIESLTNNFKGKKIYNSFSGGVDSSYVQFLLKKYGHDVGYTVTYPSGDRTDKKYSEDIGRYLSFNHNVVEIDENEIIKYISNGVISCEVPYIYEGEYLLNFMYKKINENNIFDDEIILMDGCSGDSIFGTGRVYLELNYLTNKKFLNIFDIFLKTFGLFLFPKLMRRRYHVMIDGVKRNNIDAIFLFAVDGSLNKIDFYKKVFNLTDLNIVYDDVLKKVQQYDAPLIETLYRMRFFKHARVQRVRYDNMKDKNIIGYFPYQTKELEKYLINVPMKRKIRKLHFKIYIKKMLEKYVPKKYVYRKKSSTGFDIGSLYDRPQFRKLIEEIKSRKYTFFNFDYDAIFSKKEHKYIALKIINFHLWYKLVIDS